MHQSSLEKMADFRNRYLAERDEHDLTILDLGSMDINGSYRAVFESSHWRYKGLDLSPGKNVDIVLKNPYDWPEIPSNAADVFISGQAFEHIEYFWITMLEIERVLKPGGLCCIIAPSGGFEHRYPVDCWRFYPDGFRALARFANFKILEVHTQWVPNPEYVKDDSNLWKDTVLICTKEKLAFHGSLFRWIRFRFLHKMLVGCCPECSRSPA